MTLEDLREHGVLLPEEEWGAHRLETTVPEWPVLAALLLSAVCWLLIYLGDGGRLTWFAVTGFLLLLYTVVWLCDRAVLRQVRRTRRERREVESATGSHADTGGSDGPGGRIEGAGGRSDGPGGRSEDAGP